jgi:hypothetical protein
VKFGQYIIDSLFPIGTNISPSFRDQLINIHCYFVMKEAAKYKEILQNNPENKEQLQRIKDIWSTRCKYL